MSELRNFFNPRAVAIVGASRDKTKIGRQVLDNVIAGGFLGPVYPINPKEKEIAGRKAYASLSKLPSSSFKTLLAVIAIPAPFVLAEVEKCAALGIKNLIIITAGFKEAGAEGAAWEEKIAAVARHRGLNILGPNCLGLINTWSRLNATFASADKATGNIALLSQSGAIGSAALDWLKEKDFNFGYFVSLGNKVSLDENRVIEYLATDKKIALIVAYLEEIKQGEKLMRLISSLAKRKPVAILKAGISAAGSQLALSHTGSLAGSAAAVRTGLERAGAIWLESLEELFNLLLLFREAAWHNQSSSDLHIITNAGGVAVLAVDEISRQNLPFGGSRDLLGDADAKRYEVSLRQMLADRKVNNLLVLLTPQTSTEPLKTAQAIVRAAKKYSGKLVMASFVGGEAVIPARDYLEKNNIPSFDYPEEAVRSFKKLAGYKQATKELKTYQPSRVKAKKAIISSDYLHSLRLLASYGIPVIRTSRYLAGRSASYRYPAALKVVGPDFLHKSDKGGVVLGLEKPSELKSAARRLAAKNKRILGNPDNYLVVQPQAKKSQEIILGFRRDASFGPIIMVGLGGIYTEIFKEIRLSTGDLDFSRALEMVKGLKTYPILAGARGQKGYDVNGLAKALASLARLASEHPEIKELDINPLFVQEKVVAAGDVRVILAAEEPERLGKRKYVQG